MKTQLIITTILALTTLNSTSCELALHDHPIASDSVISHDGTLAIRGQLVAEDPDYDQVTFRIVRAPDYGDLDLDTFTGEFTYYPDNKWGPEDSFSFRATDGLNDSNLGVVTILASSNRLPIAEDSFVSVQENGVHYGYLNGSDPDGDPLVYQIQDQPTAGSVVILNASTGYYRYEPFFNTVGEDRFTYRVSDDRGGIAVAEVEVDIY